MKERASSAGFATALAARGSGLHPTAGRSHTGDALRRNFLQECIHRARTDRPAGKAHILKNPLSCNAKHDDTLNVPGIAMGR